MGGGRMRSLDLGFINKRIPLAALWSTDSRGLEPGAWWGPVATVQVRDGFEPGLRGWRQRMGQKYILEMDLVLMMVTYRGESVGGVRNES